MTVKLDKEAFKMEGTCDKCGGKLYNIDIDSGEACCEQCEQIETFDVRPINREMLTSPD